MTSKLIFYYSRENRWSVNALAGALAAAALPGLKLSFPGTAEEFRREVSAAGPRDAAAVSFFTCQRKAAAGLAASLARPGGPLLVAGGPHASALPEDALAMGFGLAVAGEGEAAVLDLAKELLAGRRPEGIVRAGPAGSLDDYPSFPAKLGLYGPIEISRGCPYACTYCQTSYLHGGRPRHRSVRSVLEHMRAILDYGLKDVRFTTPDAFGYGSPDGRRLNLPALTELLESAGALAEKKGGRIFFGSFPSEVRPEHITPETLALAAAHVSNRRLIIGAQTGSPRLLKAIRRGHTVADVLRACDLCRARGFFPYVDFIFGLPGETRADEKATEELIMELSARGAMIHTHAFMPLPGTPLYGEKAPGLSRTAVAFLEKMESRGKAFGKWRAQRKIAAEPRGPKGPGRA